MPFNAVGLPRDEGRSRLSVGALRLFELAVVLPRVDRALAALRQGAA